MTNATYNPLDLTGARVLVTGASSGIGRATAILLSRLGADVVLNGRKADRLAETAALLEGQRHRVAPFDLDNFDQIDGWLKELVRENGPFQGLVHAAGSQSMAPVTRLMSKQVRAQLTTNLESALALAKSFGAPEVCPGPGGSLVFLSSVLATVGSRGRTLYAATKGAIEGLVPSLALELAPRKVRVNGVAPSFVRTPMMAEIERFWSEAQRAEVERSHPLGIGQPDDIAQVCAFLLSPAANWVTGTILVADGGFSAQ